MGVGWWLVRARERSRRVSDVALTVLAAATVVLVVAVVLDGPGTSSSLVVDRTPSPLPTVDSAASEVSVVASPPALQSAAASAAAPSPAGTGTPADTDDPSGPGIRLNLTAVPDGPLRARVTIRVRDDDASWNGGTVTFGDGTRHTFPTSTRCTTGTGASDLTRTVTHTYRRPSTYSVMVTVRTDRRCTSTPAETASRGVLVTVSRGAATAPSPTAAGSARPSPTRSAAAPRPTTPPPSPAPSPTTAEPTPTPTPTPAPTGEPSPDPTGAPAPAPRSG